MHLEQKVCLGEAVPNLGGIESVSWAMTHRTVPGVYFVHGPATADSCVAPGVKLDVQ